MIFADGSTSEISLWRRTAARPGSSARQRRCRRDRFAESACEQIEVHAVDDRVVVEISLGPRLARLAEIAGERVEIDRVNRSVVVRIGQQVKKVDVNRRAG